MLNHRPLQPVSPSCAGNAINDQRVLSSLQDQIVNEMVVGLSNGTHTSGDIIKQVDWQLPAAFLQIDWVSRCDLQASREHDQSLPSVTGNTHNTADSGSTAI